MFPEGCKPPASNVPFRECLEEIKAERQDCSNSKPLLSPNSSLDSQALKSPPPIIPHEKITGEREKAVTPH